MGNTEPTSGSLRVEGAAGAGLAGVGAEASGDAAAPAASSGAGFSRGGKLLVAGVAVLALVALLWPRGEAATAPGGFLVDAGGRPAPLAERMQQRVTLLHFWATWCPPCRPELPAVVRLADDLRENHDFGVVMVAVGDDVQAARQLAGPAADRVLYDPQWDVAHRYGTRQLPESYLIVDGKVARKFAGSVDWDDAKVRADLQRTIDGAAR